MSVDINTRKKKSHSFAYDIALSFAEESRPFVGRVAALLKQKGLKIYYDDDERINAWGEPLQESLSRVYLHEARFCVIFISAHYKLKYWTQYEQEWSKARAFFTDNEAYILPFRLDDTEIPGITDTIGYLSVRTHNETQLAEAVWLKASTSRKSPLVFWRRCRDFLSDRIRVAVTALVALGCTAVGFSLVHTSVGDLPDIRGQDTVYIGPADQKAVRPALQTALKAVPVKKAWRFKAVCRDGWISQSQGPGTCSHHGGVIQYLDTVVYGATIEECRKKLMRVYHPAPGYSRQGL